MTVVISFSRHCEWQARRRAARALASLEREFDRRRGRGLAGSNWFRFQFLSRPIQTALTVSHCGTADHSHFPLLAFVQRNSRSDATLYVTFVSRRRSDTRNIHLPLKRTFIPQPGKERNKRKDKKERTESKWMNDCSSALPCNYIGFNWKKSREIDVASQSASEGSTDDEYDFVWHRLRMPSKLNHPARGRSSTT